MQAIERARDDVLVDDVDLVRWEFEAIVAREWGGRDAVDDDTGATGDADRGAHQPRAPRATPHPATRWPRGATRVRERSPP